MPLRSMSEWRDCCNENPWFAAYVPDDLSAVHWAQRAVARHLETWVAPLNPRRHPQRRPLLAPPTTTAARMHASPRSSFSNRAEKRWLVSCTTFRSTPALVAETPTGCTPWQSDTCNDTNWRIASPTPSRSGTQCVSGRRDGAVCPATHTRTQRLLSVCMGIVVASVPEG